ncbi:MAG: hypothetical protein WED07_12900 [Candidatus Freyarchaeum deiterrae]
MSTGRRSGAGVALGLSIVGFVFFLFFFWPIAFAILFVGLAIFCALQSGQRTERAQIRQERRARRRQPTIQPQRPQREPSEPNRYDTYNLGGRVPSRQSGVRIPVEESETESESESETETGRIFRMPTEEESEASTSISERLIPREEPRVSGTAEENTELKDLEEELDATRAKYESMGTTVEATEKTETPPEKQVTVPDEKAERIEDLDSEEQATRVLLEELKDRWMSGKIDIDMYERLKEKYEKKIEDIEKQIKET